jgi:hypothetical protein
MAAEAFFAAWLAERITVASCPSSSLNVHRTGTDGSGGCPPSLMGMKKHTSASRREAALTSGPVNKYVAVRRLQEYLRKQAVGGAHSDVGGHKN